MRDELLAALEAENKEFKHKLKKTSAALHHLECEKDAR
jgi:hypothetical protein